MPSTAAFRAHAVARARTRQQVRNFRIGGWSSYLDAAFQREMRRRYRMAKHAYADSVNRKLSWDRECSTLPWSMKALVRRAWLDADARSGGRYVNVDELRRWARQEKNDGPTSERSVSHWIFKERSLCQTDAYQEPIKPHRRTIRYMEHPFADDIAPHSSAPTSQVSSTNDTQEPEYDIDPITNRKVLRQPKTEIPVKTFKSYRSQFNGFMPPDEECNADVTADLERYKPFRFNEPHGQVETPPCSVAEGLREFDSKDVKGIEFDSEKPNTGDDLDPSGLDSYTPFKFNEPHGQASSVPDPASEHFEDPIDYSTPFMFNEPHGQASVGKDTAAERVQDSQNYQAFMFNEPHGQVGPTTDTARSRFFPFDTAEELEDLDLLRASDVRAAVGSRRPVQESRRDGGDSEPPVNRHGSVFISDDSDKKLTGSFIRDFPEDFQATWSAHSSNADSLLPNRENEIQYEEIQYSNQQEVHPNRLEPALDRSIAVNQEPDIDSYSKHPQGLETSFSDELWQGKVQSEADPYGKEPQGLETHFAEEEQYRSLSASADPYCRVPQGLETNYADETTENSQTVGDPYSKSPQGLETSFMDEQSVEHFEAAADPYSKQPQGLETQFHEETQENSRVTVDLYCKTPRGLETSFSSEVSEISRQAAADSFSKRPQGLETQYAKEKEAEAVVDPFSKSPQGLETHYAKEQQLKEAADPFSTAPQGLETQYAKEQQTKTAADPFSKKPQGLETQYAKEQQNLAAEADPYSREPQGLETHFAEEACDEHGRTPDVVAKFYGSCKDAESQGDENLVGEIRNIYEDSYGPIGTEQFAPAHEVESNLYRILVYDPVTQKVELADASSVVTDSSVPLTPAEALLELNSPGKFLPYFEVMHKQGYEIASGSGDVLVFRKIRDEHTVGPDTRLRDMRHHINPVDGMRSQFASSRFASPTGFVNYDEWTPDSETAAQPFKSGIDVRREEPVFSGAKTSSQEKTSNKTGRRMLIGASWVAACSYAIGVVSEYFRTGGSDGQGPVGF